MPGSGSGMGADLGPACPGRSRSARCQQIIEHRYGRRRRQETALAQGCFPEILQPRLQLSSHRRSDVAVHSPHARCCRHLVSDPLRLQNVADAEVVQPRLVTMPQPVRGQPAACRKP
jgi:hypothetical protein